MAWEFDWTPLEVLNDRRFFSRDEKVVWIKNGAMVLEERPGGLAVLYARTQTDPKPLWWTIHGSWSAGLKAMKRAVVAIYAYRMDVGDGYAKQIMYGWPCAGQGCNGCALKLCGG